MTHNYANLQGIYDLRFKRSQVPPLEPHPLPLLLGAALME